MHLPKSPMRVLVACLVLVLANACDPSPRHICVTHDGGVPGAFWVDVGNGATKNGRLVLEAGIEYQFEMVGRFTYPFALSTDARRAATPIVNGVSGDNPCSKGGDTLTFTPSHVGEERLYYNSVKVSGLGGVIDIANTCQPEPNKFCVFHNATVEHGSMAFSVDTGDGLGPTRNRALTLRAGNTYHFEVVGPSFRWLPFVLSSSSISPSPILSTWVQGVSGANPATRDNDRLVFSPPRNGPSLLFYQTTAASLSDDLSVGSAHTGIGELEHIGGEVHILNACVPSPVHICVTVLESVEPLVTPSRPKTSLVFAVDTGSGPISRGSLELQAGSRYEFEMSFSDDSRSPTQHPFVLVANVSQTRGDPPFAPYADAHAISGDNPATADGAVLVILPMFIGPTHLQYMSVRNAQMGGLIHITGACVPSATHVCVTLTDSNIRDALAFAVDTGGGPVIRGSLLLDADKTYTFEMSSITDGFMHHPFALSSADGGVVLTQGVQGVHPAARDDDIFTFTPQHFGSSQYFYQSARDSGMGGVITIRHTCNPSATNICVWLLEDADGAVYAVDTGKGPVKRGSLGMHMGTVYTLEMTGGLFGVYPLALTSHSSKATTPLVDGVWGMKVASQDDDRIVFLPDEYTPSTVYYQSVLFNSMGGEILILPRLHPSLSVTGSTSVFPQPDSLSATSFDTEDDRFPLGSSGVLHPASAPRSATDSVSATFESGPGMVTNASLATHRGDPFITAAVSYNEGHSSSMYNAHLSRNTSSPYPSSSSTAVRAEPSGVPDVELEQTHVEAMTGIVEPANPVELDSMTNAATAGADDHREHSHSGHFHAEPTLTRSVSPSHQSEAAPGSSGNLTDVDHIGAADEHPSFGVSGETPDITNSTSAKTNSTSVKTNDACCDRSTVCLFFLFAWMVFHF